MKESKQLGVRQHLVTYPLESAEARQMRTANESEGASEGHSPTGESRGRDKSRH